VQRKRLANWSEEEVMALIAAYQSEERLPAENGENADAFFRRVRARLASRGCQERTAKGIREKWSSLTAMYR